MTMTYESRMLIDGKLVEAAGGATYDNINPATEAVIGPVADANAADMDRRSAPRGGRSTRPNWSTEPRVPQGVPPPAQGRAREAQGGAAPADRGRGGHARSA